MNFTTRLPEEEFMKRFNELNLEFKTRAGKSYKIKTRTTFRFEPYDFSIEIASRTFALVEFKQTSSFLNFDYFIEIYESKYSMASAT